MIFCHHEIDLSLNHHQKYRQTKDLYSSFANKSQWGYVSFKIILLLLSNGQCHFEGFKEIRVPNFIQFVIKT